MNQVWDFLLKKQELGKLDKWGKEFWGNYEEKRESKFAQQGYEDKGYGHIKQIVSNVGDLLENYSDVLYKLNHPENNQQHNEQMEEVDFYTDFLEHLGPNLIMFFTAAHLHDIGMNFAGVFEALKDLVGAGVDSALHISKIIQDYHHYASFIVLLELEHIMDKEEIKKNEIEKLSKKEVDILLEECRYLKNIPGKDRIRSIKDLAMLITYLREIYKKYFQDANQNGFNEKEFFIILAILCLRHKEVNREYVQSILRKFRHHHEDTIRSFNKWWDFFERAVEWAEGISKRLPGSLDRVEKTSKKNKEESDRDIFPELISYKRSSGEEKTAEKKLDLLFVEALLQYGDKTEITIARLSRNPQDGEEKLPLERFFDDVQWDNREGSMCTEMARQVISNFARFRACRFIPLFRVEVKRDKDDNENSTDSESRRLDIILHYFRFANDKDVFPVLRYHNEKDFYDLKFLERIRTRLPFLLRYLKENPFLDIKFSKKEHTFPTKDDELKERFDEDTAEIQNSLLDAVKGCEKLQELIGAFRRKENEEDCFPYTAQNKKAIFEFSQAILNPEAKHRAQGRNRVFYETGDLIVPSSFELMAILNLFMEEE